MLDDPPIGNHSQICETDTYFSHGISAKSTDMKLIGASISMNKLGKICQNMDTVNQTTQSQSGKNLVGTTIKEKGDPSWKRFP